MAEPAMSVTPYWELTFDADGDPEGGRRDRSAAEVARRGVRDLIVFAHGWNTDRSAATRLYSRFFAPFRASRRPRGSGTSAWCGRPCGSRTSRSRTSRGPGRRGAVRRPALDKDTRHALLETFPGRATVGRPDRPPARATAARGGRSGGVRTAGTAAGGRRAARAAGAVRGGHAGRRRAAGRRSADRRCSRGPRRRSARSSPGPCRSTGGPASGGLPSGRPVSGGPEAGAARGPGVEGFSLPDPWDGAHELLRPGDVLRDEAARGHGRRARARPGRSGSSRRRRPGCGCIWWGTASAAGWCPSRCADCPRACAR